MMLLILWIVWYFKIKFTVNTKKKHIEPSESNRIRSIEIEIICSELKQEL